MTAYSHHLPIINQLANAPTHAARAELLLRTPLQIIADEHGRLAFSLTNMGFQRAADYVHETRAALYSVRGKDGSLPPRVQENLDAIEHDLAQMVRDAEPVTELDGECRSESCDCPLARGARQACASWRWKNA